MCAVDGGVRNRADKTAASMAHTMFILCSVTRKVRCTDNQILHPEPMTTGQIISASPFWQLGRGRKTTQVC